MGGIGAVMSIPPPSPPSSPYHLQDHPCVPVNVSVIGNTCCNCSNAVVNISPKDASAWYSVVANNSDFQHCAASHTLVL